MPHPGRARAVFVYRTFTLYKKAALRRAARTVPLLFDFCCDRAAGPVLRHDAYLYRRKSELCFGIAKGRKARFRRIPPSSRFGPQGVTQFRRLLRRKSDQTEKARFAQLSRAPKERPEAVVEKRILRLDIAPQKRFIFESLPVAAEIAALYRRERKSPQGGEVFH